MRMNESLNAVGMCWLIISIMMSIRTFLLCWSVRMQRIKARRLKQTALFKIVQHFIHEVHGCFHQVFTFILF